MVKAFINPIRIQILDALIEAPASIKELSVRLDVPRQALTYQLGILRATGCVKLAEPERPGAADERIYEATPLAMPTRRLAQPALDRSGLGHASPALMQSILLHGVPERGEDLLGKRKDQISCASVLVDKQAWREMSLAVGEMIDRISTAHRNGTQRLAEGDEEPIEARIAVALFEAPGGGSK